MKIRLAVQGIFAGFILVGAAGLLRADPTNPPPAKLDRKQIREQLQNLPPEERRVMIQELRAQRAARTNEPSMAEQRRAKLKAKVESLQRKKADGTITPEEQQQLDRLEQSLKRAEEKRAKRPTDPGPSAEKPSSNP